MLHYVILEILLNTILKRRKRIKVMRKSIKKMIGIRVAAAVISILLFSIVTTVSIIRIKNTQVSNVEANELLDRIQKAEVAHYKWSSNLSNALYAGTEFTGSMDPTGCVLGQWVYGETNTDNEKIESLRTQIEPLHKELHESASHVLELLKTDPEQAQAYYQDTIQSNLTTLVGLLDQIVTEVTQISEENSTQMRTMILVVEVISNIFFVIALACLISLVLYVLHKVVRPILLITTNSRPLSEGRLDLHLNYHEKDELGDLAVTLEDSMKRIHSYVTDINHIMSQLSNGDFNVHTSTPFIGDFRSIEESIDSFTSTISTALAQISHAEQQVSGHANHLSTGAQSLAQGAVEQASAVEELYATLEELSKTAEQNVKMAASAQENARLTGEQVTQSSQHMDQMVTAMSDITAASQQIGKVIATIENIASQTNILSINAGVEAARAGEAGKGFSVVANEVRGLATQSDEAAKATKELIENSMEATERGRQIVEEVSAVLQKTLKLVVQSNDNISTIAKAIEGEASSIAQVTEGISQISVVVQSNSASSEESAAVSSELFDQVRLLQEQVKKFRLKK